MPSISPIGPWPITSTVSPCRGPASQFPSIPYSPVRYGSLIEAHGVRNRDDALLDDPVHDPDVLGKSAAGWLAKARRCAHPLVHRALREHLEPTVVALPQGIWWKTITRSPSAKRVTPAPRATTTPAISCPKMRGAECDPVEIFFRSVPQMPQQCIRTNSSPGPIPGTEPSPTAYRSVRNRQRPASGPESNPLPAKRSPS